MERADLESTSAAATERAAEAVGRGLAAGDVVLIAGEVGTGKTTFVRGACRALGVTDPVTSPSFTIGQTYAGRVPVAHVDLFRLEDLEAEDPALLADYVTPERVVLDLRLSHLGGDRRRVEALGHGKLVAALRDAL